MKLKWKLFFSYLLIVLIPFLAAERYIASHLEDRLLNQVKDRLFEEALLLKALIEKDYAARAPSYEIDPLVKKMGRSIRKRVTFIDWQGVVLGDTEVPAGRLREVEDHSGRPEFKEAMKSSHGVSIRYSTTLKIEMMYLAVKAESRGELLGVVRVAVPLIEVDELIRNTELSLASAFVLCVLLILALNVMVSRRLSQPVEEITRAAQEISRGNFDIRAYPGARGELGLLGRSIDHMASEIKRRVHEITQEKETLQTILGSMSDGVMVVDAQGEIILTNRVLEELAPGAVGKSPVEVIRSAELQEGFTKVLVTGETFRMELSVSTPEGDRVFRVTIALLMPGDTPEGCVAVFHDITDLKRLESIRRDFVANVSHEFRTPLTSIKGYAEILSEEGREDSAKRRSFARIILNHANRLAALVSDLLSLTRLEFQSVPAVKEELDLGELIETSILTVRPSAEAQDVGLHTESMPEETIAWANREQIGQALVNLLDNAVKYTPRGGAVKVSVSDAGKEIEVTVADTGIGIPREDLNRVFERFYRVDKNRSRELGGTGLGLAIVKHIIKAHGGRVWVKSEIEEGSTFGFSLPKRQDRENAS